MTTLNGYQHWTSTTAVYPEADTGSERALTYVSLGLASEAGEAAGKAKKMMRDGDTGELRAALLDELGDALWYLARTAHELGYPLSVIAERNLAKLEDRAERGALQGSGDQR